MRRFIKRLKGRWGSAFQSNDQFIEAAFREILGRNADLDGLNHYRRVLREGVGRTAVLLEIMRSEESTAKLTKRPSSLPSLRSIRPERYRDVVDRSNGQTIPVFEAASNSDFDWLETAIMTNGYYENPGVWNLGIDADKRVIAEIVASFPTTRVLELGCASGAVLECLQDYGVMAEGVEISSMALAHASPRVRDRIHHGDLLSLDLKGGYDLVFGLDIFEHLNPNRIDMYISRLTDILSRSGYLFCNIPVFGADPVFGTVFPFYIDGWDYDASAERPFSTLQVDELGYPIHGHLTWADAQWWAKRFAAHGFNREMDIERALHDKYDRYMEKRAPARRSYFVWSRNSSANQRANVIRRIVAAESLVIR